MTSVVQRNRGEFPAEEVIESWEQQQFGVRTSGSATKETSSLLLPSSSSATMGSTLGNTTTTGFRDAHLFYAGISQSVVHGPQTRMVMFQRETSSQLDGYIHHFDKGYTTTQYLDLAGDSDIDAFLKKNPSWDDSSRRWGPLLSATNERELHARMRTILNSILSKLGRMPTCGPISRQVCTTDYKSFSHVEPGPCLGGSTPPIVVKAAGPSFQLPGDGEKLGYTNVTSCFDVHREEELKDNDTHHIERSAVFARQMLIQQPNRRFVRNLLITDWCCHLIHFDRSGLQFSPAVNIHDDPYTFVRLVLGVSSMDEETLGLDTSVRWTIKGGKKVDGSITVTNAEKGETSYRLLDMNPIFRRYDLFGRSTTGWRAVTSDGVEVFVKDCWRPDDANPEYNILKHTTGIDGASQMLTYEGTEVTTATIRARGCAEWELEGFLNRVSTRIVLERCGPSIFHFRTRMQLLAGIRDAIAAHQHLVNDRNVLHRDISISNILLGEEDSCLGRRGFLVDYDNAVHGERPLAQTVDVKRVGTPLFMSISVLTSHYARDPCPNHDPQDDLESFFYVLLEMVCFWEGPGKRVSGPRPEELLFWDDWDPSMRRSTKKAFFSPKELETGIIQPYWLPAVVKLMARLYRIIREAAFRKDMLRDVKFAKDEAGLRELLARTDEFYERVLVAFDDALSELAVEERPTSPIPEASPLPNPAPPSPSLPPSPPINTLKRKASAETTDASAPKKRSKRAIEPPSSPRMTRSRTKATACARKPSQSSLADPLASKPKMRSNRSAKIAVTGTVTRGKAREAAPSAKVDDTTRALCRSQRNAQK